MLRSLTLSLILFSIPLVSFAETVVRVGDGIKVDEAQTVDGDYYVSVGPFGNTTMSGAVAGDMYALGGSVTVNGSIGEDLSIVSGSAQLHASVTDDVRLLTGEATIAEAIGGDLFVVGGTLRVLSTASVAGNIYFFGGSAIIDAPIEGSIYGTMERLRINSTVGGGVDVRTYESVTLGSKALIEGDVVYNSAEPLIRAPEAVVEGNVRAETPRDVSSQERLQSFVIPLFVILFASLSIYLLFGKELAALFAVVSHSYPRSAVVGFCIIILGPIVSILLMATVLGLLIGIISLAATVILIGLGVALSGAVFGMWLGTFMKAKRAASLMWITVGTVTLYLLSFIPIIGPIVLFAFILLAIGGVTIGLYRLQN